MLYLFHVNRRRYANWKGDVITYSWQAGEENNINMDSEIIFDNDEYHNSEILYPAVEKANAVLRKMASLSSDSVHAIRQRLQLAVEGKAELSLKDVGELLLATKYLMLSTEEGKTTCDHSRIWNGRYQ